MAKPLPVEPLYQRVKTLEGLSTSQQAQVDGQAVSLEAAFRKTVSLEADINSLTARAQLIESLDTRVKNNSASITEVLQTVTSLQEAQASVVTELAAEVSKFGGVSEADLVAEQVARAAADSAMAADILALEAAFEDSDVGALTAALDAEILVRANADTALASDITTLTATVGDVQAEATVLTNAFVTGGVPNTNWGVDLNANGVITGIKATAVGGPAPISEVAILASSFKIQNTDGTVTATPFSVVGANVKIEGDLTILTTPPTSLADINGTESTKLSGIENNATAGATWDSNVTGQPTNLTDLNPTEGAKLSGIDDNATAGADWGTNLTGRPVELTDGRISTALNAAGTVVTKVVPSSLAAASTSGLYLGSDRMGFYDGATWKSYMDNSGNFYLSGSGGDSLAWDGSTLTVTGDIDSSTITGSSIVGGSVLIGTGANKTSITSTGFAFGDPEEITPTQYATLELDGSDYITFIVRDYTEGSFRTASTGTNFYMGLYDETGVPGFYADRDGYVRVGYRLQFGSLLDTNLYRESANKLRTDDSFHVEGDLTVTGSIPALKLDNTDAFTPTADYHPATKKYVDDNAGGGSAKAYGSFYLSTGGLTGLSSTAVTLTLNNTAANSGSMTLSSSEVTVSKTGVFSITADAYLNNSSTSRTEYSIWLEVDENDGSFVEIPGTRCGIYQRGYDSGSTGSITTIRSCSSGFKYRIRCQRTDGAGTAGYQDNNGTRLTIVEL
jgi:hypothetical protein